MIKINLIGLEGDLTMKHVKKISSVIIASSIVMTTVGTAYAEESKIKNADFSDPVFIQGEDLNKNQLDETKEKLNVKQDEDTIKVGVNDVSKYVSSSSNLTNIYSSGTIEKKNFGSGVDVTIDTPDTIQKVTQEQYTNAAITAGMKNVNIHIASVEPVTGEGALAGISKAYEEKGHTLNQNDVQNANQEMSDLNNISEENKGKDGYSDAALNGSIADIKEQLADIQKKQDEQLTEKQVEDVVNKVLDERGLNNMLTDNQKQTIINNMVNLSQSNVFQNNPKDFGKQANKLLKSIDKNHGDLIEKAKNKFGENQNILEKFVAFIKNIIQVIIDFFKSLF